MNDNRQNTALLTVIAVATLLVAVVGATFAYFTTTANTGSTSTITATTGTMAIEFNDGADTLQTKTDFQPSDAYIVEKTFTITGTNTATGQTGTGAAVDGEGLTMPFTVELAYKNEFTADALHYYIKRIDGNGDAEGKLSAVTLGGTAMDAAIPGHASDTGYNEGTLVNSPTTETYVTLASGDFKPGATNVTVQFSLKVTFPDTGESQDIDKNKSLTARVVVNRDMKANAGQQVGTR